MKIFGLQLWGKKKEVIADVVPEIKPVTPTIKTALVPRVQDPVMSYRDVQSSGRGRFEGSEYNLAEIGRIQDTDSYVRQAFKKQKALMFKEGWDLVGRNPKTIKYIKARFEQIAQASGIPTQLLLRQIGQGLIEKSNSFIVKVRNEKASGGKIRKIPGQSGTIKPIAGYFVLPPETMEFEMSGNKITKWRQLMPGGMYREHDPKDIVHFFYDRKEGFVFGTPVLTPVIDDVRALRKIEENIELLIYQHLFPLFQYIVGTAERPAGMTETGESEVDIVRREIQYMPTEGGIVTPERHEIRAIGAEGRAIRAEGYLEHFKQRVFAGLGVSSVDMGDGQTANRSTADNMSRNMVDSVKDFQQVLEILVNEFIIKELLLESTFGNEVLEHENRCFLQFKEIDVDAQIKKENHNADQFTKDALTWDELRRRNGNEPIQIPTSKEIEAGTATSENYPEWFRTRWKLFAEPELLIQSIDEPYSPTARALARSTSTETTQPDLEEAGEEQKERDVELEKEKAKAKAKNAPSRPSASKPSASRSIRNGYLSDTYTTLMQDVVERISREKQVDLDWIASHIRTYMTSTVNKLVSEQIMAFQKGYSNYRPIGDKAYLQRIAVTRTLLKSRAEHYVNKLTEDILNSMRRNLNTETPDLVTMTRAIFESTKFRTQFIEDVEVRKAETYGKVIAYGLNTKEQAFVISIVSDGACAKCNEREISLSIATLTLDSVPPYHAGCSCILKFKKNQMDLFQDSIEEESTECPKCGKTAIKSKETTDTYKCRACSYTFKKIVDDQGDKDE